MARIHEKRWIEVNGTRQGMFLTGDDTSNPVLLFVHGGPGMPEYWLTKRYPTGWEQAFTVAWWDQRGAGLSFRARPRDGALTIDQLVDDTLAVADHLRSRFGVDRIYLLGHSWGSLLGIKAAARGADRFHAYVGIAQVTHQIASELRSYQYLLDEYRRRGDHRMLRRLEAAPVTTPRPPLPRGYVALRDKAMHRAGVGTTREMRSVVTGLFLPSWRFDEYTLGEKIDLWRGKLWARRAGLWAEMLATDLTRDVRELAMPAYFLHGVHDYTVSYPMAREYARALRAPVVGFYTFHSSAHSPQFEEPGRTLKTLTRDVLAGSDVHADPETG